MMYKMIDLPPNVIGFKALWQVTEKDVEEVLSPIIQDHIEKTGHSNFLLVLQDLNRNLKMNTIKTLDHLTNLGHKLKRIAVVADLNSSSPITKSLDAKTTYELKEFSHEELNEAIHWASEQN